ncbi:LysR substrate-binding domain-containing protein [Mesorhizobium neociceri]|uniref:LysR family transcriptional regulator n=1 Tax=Mesorhizobium neociceri TaxID=1307853 RepID=A0A838AXI9_9HYPH|nr:LysR substrate-binding domain-containing protein [Mesorhizobium neociceri]MBA1138775.1 LysR family transcriptional regulator [Mesorhizobium neociceri]
MRYVQLRAFHQVAISGGFSRAAEALFLTQPAISDQVRKLEEEYDVLLFNRNKKQVTLTQSGQKLLDITHRMFDTEQQALELLTESRALRSGTLRIVADAAHHLLHILGSFRARYPGVQVSVRAGNTETVISSLYSYDADIGVLGEVPTGRDFEVLKLNSTPIIAFASIDHPLAGKKSLTLKQLAQESLVMRERGSKTRQKLEDLAGASKIELRPVIEAEGREAVREIVASGAGIGFVSAAEFGQDSRLVPITIDAPETLMDEALICLRERSGGKLVRAFLDMARSMSVD